MGVKILKFTKFYIKSMRLYFAFITGIAGWIGVSFYHFTSPETFSYARSVIILAILFLAYGVNQIFNDYFGLEEDRINAPNRPMVSGELNPNLAALVSIIILLFILVFSYFLSPWSVAPVLLGIVLNLLYEYAKSWSLIGNAVFGLSIAMCTVYGFLAAGPLPDPVFTSNRISAFFLVAILNGVMTYFTYFKDYEGDKQAGKKTFIVKHGIKVARYAGVIGAFVPTIAFFFMAYMKWLPFKAILDIQAFTYCGIMTLFLQIWTAWLFFMYPQGERTFFSLVTNIRACVAGQITIIAMFNDTLALYLLSASYIFIGFLFDLYSDAKA